MSSRPLRRRVGALEQRIGRELTTIVVKGGFQDRVGGFASAFGGGVGLEFERRDDESEDHFRERCEAAALAAGARFLIIGGGLLLDDKDLPAGIARVRTRNRRQMKSRILNPTE